MKLVHKQTGNVVVEFKDNITTFHNPFLEKEIKQRGIFIPPFMRDQFDGKEIVFMTDPLFEKAFVDVYWQFTMPKTQYEWQD